jgi:hypothetical protein
MRQINRLIGGLDKINDTIELSTKLAGYKMLKRKDNMSAEARAHTIRTQVGTPDFYEGGTATHITNRLFMFSNVGLQGLRESYNVIKEHPVRAAVQTFMYSFIPSMLQVAAERGFLPQIFKGAGLPEEWGKWLQDAWMRIPRFQRVYRWAFPLHIEPPKYEGGPPGRVYFIPMPLSEMGMVSSGMLYHTINAGIDAGHLDGHEFVNDLSAILNDLGSTIPGNIHPVGKAGWAVWTKLRGQNPIDDYTQAPIIPKRKAGISHISDWSYVGQYAWNSVGLGTFWRLDGKTLDFKDKNWVEKGLGLPVIGNPLGRFIRVTDAGLDERKRETDEERRLRRARAREEYRNKNRKQSQAQNY